MSTPPLPANRRGLLAVTLTAAMFGATFGLTLPLITLVLESWGASKTIIGVNAAMPGLAAVICAPFYPRIIAHFGLMAFIYGCIGIVVATLLMFSAVPVLEAWFAIRFFNGAAAIGLFMSSELWVNGLANDATRGRYIAIFTMSVSLGFLTGPLILSLVGVGGALPFVMAAGLISVSGLCLTFAGDAVPMLDHSSKIRITDLFVLAPVVACAAFLDGLLFMGIQALLPTYSLAVGLSALIATRAIAWFAVGMLTLPILAGMLADRFEHTRVLIGIAALGSVLLWTLPVGFALPLPRAVVLTLLGGVVNGIYTVTLTMLGTRFRAGRLAAATAGTTILFSLGELVGPSIVGVSMDIAPAGYYLSLASMATLFMLAFIGLARRETEAVAAA